MPTYEYACTSCAHEWEAEQSIKEAPLSECPACSKATARRQISRGTGFILKGGGWYSDLYASSSNKPAKSDGGSGSTGSEGKGSGSDSASSAAGSTKSDASASSATATA
ncbi:FmdB family transcriptional regulator [Sorangium cellulosum]|uniref:FmdB family transcriptional regulator n=1 Tax=Sorangium cellulosum TaxID=56 RepID=A0A4V0ND19_SORCE|nr:zinc ribbon domain-containing protein [Sorangium cellulosum]AUX21132.1 FmdB family transcriptional regulator [Sorangium cellulosum]